jgi:acidic leucine-rich nuclear phosphoprotein 32 family protein B
MAEAAAPSLAGLLESLDADSEEVVLNETKFTLDTKGAEALGKFKKAVLVAFNACAIKELVKFPDLPELEVLELSDNDFESGLEHLQGLAKLRFIALGGCPLSLKALEPLAKLELAELDIEGCPAAEEEGHREKLFALIPSLSVLNGQDKDGNFVEEPPFDEDDEDEDYDEEDGDYDGEEDEEEEDTEQEEEEKARATDKAQKVGKVDLKSWYNSEAKDEEDDEEYTADVGEVGTRKTSKRKREAEAEPEAKKGKTEEAPKGDA